MKKLFISGNYLIAIDGNGYQREFAISKTVYTERNNQFEIKEGQIDDQNMTIEVADAVNWTNDLGDPYDANRMRTFFRENTANFSSGGASTFEDLTDTPSYAGNANKGLRINATETGIEAYVATDLNQWLIDRVAFVNPTTGDDDTAVIGDGNLPFRTLQGAIARVGSKSLYYCMPGTYTGTINLESNNYYFMEGAIAGSGSRLQDGGVFKDINIFGNLEIGINSYGFSFTGTQTQANIDCYEFNRSRQVCFVDNQANVTINCKKIRCTGNNGGGYACRVRGLAKLTLNVAQECTTYHWLVAGAFGSGGSSYSEFTINCPRIVIPVVSTYGSAFKALINDQGQAPCIYNINGEVIHEMPTSTSAFGVVESALLLYVNVGVGETGSIFNYSGGCRAIGAPVLLAYYIIAIHLP